MKKFLVLVMLCSAQVSSPADDYSKVSTNDLDKALIVAVKGGSSEEVEKLINAGANVNHTDRWGDTALIQAIEFSISNINETKEQKKKRLENTLEVVQVLLKAKANVNHQNNFGEIALVRAARMGYLEVVKELINAGANVNAADGDGKTALSHAIAQYSVDLVAELLLAPGIDVSGQISSVQTRYEDYLKKSESDKRYLENFEDHRRWLKIFELFKPYMTAKDDSKISANELDKALIKAVRNDSSDEVQKLVRSGANINQKTTYTKYKYDDDSSEITYTLLEYAAKHGYADVVKELIQKTKNDDINTALILAAQEGHAHVVRELVQAKPNVDTITIACISAARNFPGITTNASTGSRDRTALKDYLNVIKELIKAGANVNHTDKSGNTALIEVVGSCLYTKEQKNDRAEIIQALLKAKADVNHPNQEGDTALIRAIKNRDFDAVQIFLKIPKLNINHANKKGNTALIIAIQRVEYTYISGDHAQYDNCLNSQNILEILLKTPGINLHHVNKKGDTAVDLLKKLREDTRYCRY